MVDQAAEVDRVVLADRVHLVKVKMAEVTHRDLLAAAVVAVQGRTHQTVAILVVRLVMVWTTLHGQQQPQQETQGFILVEALVGLEHHPEAMAAGPTPFLVGLQLMHR
tara:strand:- start:136 stop:459 length:324 start_codon:yes stop_codon:yes gene_type:complete